MQQSFTAIDFETANGKRSSICQIGLVRFEGGVITQSFTSLVQPPNNIYWQKLTDIHGITAAQTQHAPTFNQLWPTIEPFIANQQVVAHCGFTFDFNCLQQALAYYELPIPPYKGICTYRLFGKKLNELCEQYHITLNHHNALSDAEACGKLYVAYLNQQS